MSIIFEGREYKRTGIKRRIRKGEIFIHWRDFDIRRAGGLTEHEHEVLELMPVTVGDCIRLQLEIVRKNILRTFEEFYPPDKKPAPECLTTTK